MQRNDVNWSYGEFTVNSTSAGAPSRMSLNTFDKYLLYLHLSYSTAATQVRVRILHNGAQVFPLNGWLFLAVNTAQQLVLEIDKALIGPGYGLEVQAYVGTGSITLGVGIASSERASYGDAVQIIEWLEKIFTVLRMRLAPPLVKTETKGEIRDERRISKIP